MKMMRTVQPVACLALALVVTACTAQRPFPPEVMEGVAPTFQFEAWKDASPTNNTGKADAGIKVELGGRIVDAIPQNGSGVLIVGEQLPIAKHPVYGPTDAGQRTGDYEFAVLYPDELDRKALRNGNRFVVIGTTKGRKALVVNGAPKTEPYLVADCIHIWNTGRTEIEAFKESPGAGYAALPERTYCVKK